MLSDLQARHPACDRLSPHGATIHDVLLPGFATIYLPGKILRPCPAKLQIDIAKRGNRIEEYCVEVPKVLNIFSTSMHMASAALDVFTRYHTLRIEAKELHHTHFSLTPTGPVLIGKKALPFDREKLGSLTIFFNGGSLSKSSSEAFADLTNSVENIPKCFTKLHTLTIVIEYDIGEVQDRWAPLYTVLLE
jgi:hypothetical protein